jgi:beta-N-acetylhexosaminidase
VSRLGGSRSIDRDARAVLLPAFDATDLPNDIGDHLSGGGVAVLLGESREEYLRRSMSAERRRTETIAWMQGLTGDIRKRAEGPVLIAVDQEPAGIGRLSHLIGAPDRGVVLGLGPEEMEGLARDLAVALCELGVNLVLAPIVDVVTGTNPWLEGRTLGTDPQMVAALAAGFVRGMQSGRVAATAKHFPGHRAVTADPAVDLAEVCATPESLEEDLGVFRTIIDADVAAIMVGPAPVPLVDASRPASLSPTVIDLLRTGLAFSGVVISDDLDSRATLRGITVPEAAVASLQAGVDLLLLANGPQVDAAFTALVAAVERGEIQRQRLSSAAARVRQLAGSLVQ